MWRGRCEKINRKNTTPYNTIVIVLGGKYREEKITQSKEIIGLKEQEKTLNKKTRKTTKSYIA